MARLEIRLLGALTLHRGTERLPSFPTQKARSLFAFLVVNRGRLYPRDVLAGTFWGEQSDDAARRNLRTEISRVRQTLQADRGNGSQIIVRDQLIGFDAESEYWLDVAEFESCLSDPRELARAVATGSVARLERAVELYQGDALDGFYDEWCVYVRERLKALYLRAIEALMTHRAATGDLQSALVYAFKLLSIDPLREHIHREVMRFYYGIGDRPAALTQFRGCAEMLKRELGIGPMRETIELRDAILNERVVGAGVRSGVGGDATVLGAALPDLYDTAARLDDASRLLRASIKVLEGKGGGGSRQANRDPGFRQDDGLPKSSA